MQDKNAKVNSPEQEKGFALFRSDTIQFWVWLEGYQPLDEQSLKSLSEDITYRIREILDVGFFFNLFDFNTAFQNKKF